MIICEIGLNHLGSEKNANNYLRLISKSNVDAFSFQIREKKYYMQRNKAKFLLDMSFYKKIIKDSKKMKKKVGISIADKETFLKFKDLNFDFIKILSWGSQNKKFIDFLSRVKTKKHIYISTGLSSFAEVKTIYKKIKKKKNFSFIYTILPSKSKEIDLSVIQKYKNSFKLPIAYGHHADDINILYKSLFYQPSDIFFYIKENKKIIYPDNNYAIPVSKFKKVLKEVNNFQRIC